MYTEDQLLPISAMQHLLFCERQCALIHLEQSWAENRLTVEGQHLHRKAHDPNASRSRAGVRTERGVDLVSYRLGVVGKADVIEFDIGVDGQPDHRHPRPVEYKRGKPKSHNADKVQLCAQAMCLEEMLDVTIPVATLFYGKTRRRVDLPLDQTMRDLTESTASRLHEMIASRQTPPATYEKKCDSCSLINLCLPKGVGGRRVSRYITNVITEA